mmetsp:Transcript_16215/g.48574  ORF Transcript_16215/g.48574 Transcript_16215/m.48574 type:complete len:252 (-) Transcript_16215:415-1170(-)
MLLGAPMLSSAGYGVCASEASPDRLSNISWRSCECPHGPLERAHMSRNDVWEPRVVLHFCRPQEADLQVVELRVPTTPFTTNATATDATAAAAPCGESLLVQVTHREARLRQRATCVTQQVRQLRREVVPEGRGCPLLTQLILGSHQTLLCRRGLCRGVVLQCCGGRQLCLCCVQCSAGGGYIALQLLGGCTQAGNNVRRHGNILRLLFCRHNKSPSQCHFVLSLVKRKTLVGQLPPGFRGRLLCHTRCRL